METKFTKGEWNISSLNVQCGHKYVAIVLSQSQIEAEANAKLIAAAPDLLRELTKARSLLIDEGFNTWSESIIDIDSAIKKATE